jgi:hypothetical protein
MIERNGTWLKKYSNERDVEAVDRPRSVREQRRQLVRAERRRAAPVGTEFADQRDPRTRERVGERVEQQLPGAQRRVHRAVGRARRHHGDRRVVLAEPPCSGGTGDLGQRQAQRLMREVGRRRAAGVTALACRDEVAVARRVVVAHARE